jgi:uncharacterized membrane protein
MPISAISKKPVKPYELIKGVDIRSNIFELVKNDFPEFNGESCISLDELNVYRRLYLTQLVEAEKGELKLLDQDVMKAIKENSILSENIEPKIETKMKFGDRVADKIASFGGSWAFILSFFAFLFGWMILNTWIFLHKPFDPYPYILLNLILSCTAAIQAPIIMMSQNRQEAKDRVRAEHDYKVNLKAELEIKLLSEKIDHLLVHQNKKLLEIQEVQIDYLEDLMKKLHGNTKKS